MSYQPPALLSEYTEKQWQAVVEEAAGWYGYRFQYHTHDSRRSDEGFPDLCLVHPEARRIIFFECKTDKTAAKPTQKQVDWVRALRQTGVHAWIVRPRNVDLVLAILEGVHDPPRWVDGALKVDDDLLALVENEEKVRRVYPKRVRATARSG